MAGGTKSKDKSVAISPEEERHEVPKKARATKESVSKRPVAHWNAIEKKTLKEFLWCKVHLTRFENRALLDKMELIDQVDALLERIGLGSFATMDHLTFSDPTIDFLSIFQLTYVNPRVPKAVGGMISFKVGTTNYSIFIPDVCEAYGFLMRSVTRFPRLRDGDLLWDTIPMGKYVGSRAKMRNIRNPVIRYVLKLLANTFCARKSIAAVNKFERCTSSNKLSSTSC